MSGTKTVAVIPARGGSQGIPDKNIRDFAGKPLIAWTIDVARSVSGIDRVIVSTDSERIAETARSFGAEAPFMRPANLSTADVPIEPVVAHAYQWMAVNEGYRADALVLLFPTNPLRLTSHVEAAIRLFRESGADSVITVNETPAHYTPYWTLVRDRNGRVTYFNGQDLRLGIARRQDFPQACFAKNDLVFVFRPANLFDEYASLYGERVDLLVTERIFDGDINSPEDWNMTLRTFEYLRGRSEARRR